MKKQIFILFIFALFISFCSANAADTKVYGDSTVEKQYYPTTTDGQTSVSQNENVQSGSLTTSSDVSNNTSGGNSTDESGWSIANVSGFGLPSGTIYSIITGILNWLLALIGIVGVIGFIVAGVMYILSAGDEKRAGNAKAAMTNSIIGVVVALAGYVVILAVDTFLRGSWWGNF